MKMLRKCAILTWCIPEYIFSLHIRDVPFLSPKFNSTLLFIPSEPMNEYIAQYKDIWIPDFCLWNGKSGNFFLLEFESVILLITIGIWNSRSTDKNFASSAWNPESTASNSESKIWLDSLTWDTDVMYGILQCGRKPSKRVGHLNLFLVNEKNV